ncbi:hypothetical protein [Sulfurovum sp.]|nr:hypothetical protein [Sulfurovum sp.]
MHPLENEVDVLLDTATKAKIVKLLKKDYVKTDKETLLKTFNES